MKRFLARAGTKIGRFFWSWSFLKFVLGAIAVILLLYIEEDWRGAHAWAATKAEWEAKGETFDFNKLIPPPVPDGQNLAALPLFKMEPDPKSNGDLAPLTLHQAFKNNTNTNPLPSLGNWQAGKTSDMEKVRRMVAGEYAEAFPGKPVPKDLSVQFDELYPFLAFLRKANPSFPICRFEQNYKFEPPYNLYMPLVTAQIGVAKYLTCDAVIALNAGNVFQALDDIRVNDKLIAGLRDQPILVSGLCAIGMVAINFNVVYAGLTQHAWNDAQLADIQNELAKIDFLSDYQHVMRGEAIGIVIPAFDNIKVNRRRFLDALQARSAMPKSETTIVDFFPVFWPDGWIDLMKTRSVTIDLNAASFVDPKARLVFPKAADQFAAENAQVRWNSYFPWNIFSSVTAGPIAHAVSQFARMQVWLDETRIACALERYRLAHGVFPGSLDALAPACIDELPHDIMNGQPYHYQLRPDGTYLLYSVGWNQTDDGGKVVYKTDAPTLIDYEQGDWVWPTPK